MAGIKLWKMEQRRVLKVRMVSTSYPKNATDWRGIFIKHIVSSLAHRVALELWAPPGERPAAVVDVCTPAEAAWLAQLLEQGGIAHLLRRGSVGSRLQTPLQLLAYLRQGYRRQPPVDLFHVNWLQNALPLWGLPQPALITVLGSDLGLLRLPGLAGLLRRVFKQRRCILAPNADWMVPELTRHFGEVAQIVPIPFGIDAPWYQLPRQAPMPVPRQWLVVSRLTAKKIGPLFAWGEAMFQTGEQELHLFGPMQEALAVPNWVHYHGATHPQALQDTWFRQATGLISVSQHDEGRPQVMLEAMAAGLPILASDLPAHRDFIAHQRTGYLVSSAEEFRAGLAWLSQPEHHQAVATQARAWVKSSLGTWDDCADRYLAAYHRLLST